MITRRSGYLSSIALDVVHRRGIASFYRERIHDVRMSLHNKHKQVAPIQMLVAAKEPLTDDGTKKQSGTHPLLVILPLTKFRWHSATLA